MSNFREVQVIDLPGEWGFPTPVFFLRHFHPPKDERGTSESRRKKNSRKLYRDNTTGQNFPRTLLRQFERSRHSGRFGQRALHAMMRKIRKIFQKKSPFHRYFSIFPAAIRSSVPRGVVFFFRSHPRVVQHQGKKNPASSYFPTLRCAVSSPQVLLTIVFGMGTCVSRPLLTPELK